MKWEKMSINLGDEVQCRVTAFKGIATAIDKHLTGCDRVGVRGPLKKDGSLGDEYWFDVHALKVLKKAKVKTDSVQDPKKEKFGGPPSKIK